MPASSALPPPVATLKVTPTARQVEKPGSSEQPSTNVAHSPSPDERTEIGKALRERVPRTQHGVWKKPENRPDPIDLLHQAKSAYPHHGQRVVMGQRLMQRASDQFLGWALARTHAKAGDSATIYQEA